MSAKGIKDIISALVLEFIYHIFFFYSLGKVLKDFVVFNLYIYTKHY